MESELAPEPTKETVQTTPTQSAAIHPSGAVAEVERSGFQLDSHPGSVRWKVVVRMS